MVNHPKRGMLNNLFSFLSNQSSWNSKIFKINLRIHSGKAENTDKDNIMQKFQGVTFSALWIGLCQVEVTLNGSEP